MLVGGNEKSRCMSSAFLKAAVHFTRKYIDAAHLIVIS